MASTGEVWKLGHRPALDGVRGVAILLVVGSHFGLPLSGDGGVGVFFALSGFLITALLLEEYERAGRISLVAFYGRRARRLFPALGAFLAVAAALAYGAGRFDGSDYMAAIFYFGNWVRVGGADLGFVSHTWSLAIEEQFYLAWPLVVVAVLRWRRDLLVPVLLGGIVGSLAVRLALTLAAAPLDRVKFGTDTRGVELLLGCLVAALLHQGLGRSVRPSNGWALSTVAGFVAIGYFVVPTWAPVLMALLTTALLWRVGCGDRAPIFEARWLRLVGQRSYGLYLWHWPIAHFGVLVLPGPWVVKAVLLLAASWAMTLLSWRFVEAPVLRARLVVADSADRPLLRPGRRVDPRATHTEVVVAD